MKARKGRKPLTKDAMRVARLKADAAFDQAEAVYDGLAAALLESSGFVDKRYPDRDESVFCDMFDEWCASLEDRHRAAHPSVREMPRGFYEDPEKWAKRNKYRSFTECAVLRNRMFTERMLDMLNDETDMKYTPAQVVTSYVASHADELLCRGIVELLKTHRAKVAQKELGRIKDNSAKK